MRSGVVAVSAAACALALAACGASSERAEIEGRYRAFVRKLTADRLDSLEVYLDDSSLQLLEDLAQGWEALCPGCPTDPAEILSQAFRADSGLVPVGEVKTVITRSDSGFLLLEQMGGLDTLVFLRQRGGWRLSLSPALRRIIDTFLEGTSLDHRNLARGRWPEHVRRWRERL